MQLRIPRGECNPAGKLTIQADLEGIRSGPGQGNVEDENRPCFDVDHKPNPDGVDSDLGAPPADPKHQVGPGINGGKVGEPDVLKHAEHAELALLVDQGVIGDDRKVEVQLS